MKSWLSMRVLSLISEGSGFLSFVDLFWFFHRKDSTLLRQDQIQWRVQIRLSLSWCILHTLPAFSAYMLHQQTLTKTFWGVFSPFHSSHFFTFGYVYEIKLLCFFKPYVGWKHTETDLNICFSGLSIQNNPGVMCHMTLQLSLCCWEIMPLYQSSWDTICNFWLLKGKTPKIMVSWNLSYKPTSTSPSC